MIYEPSTFGQLYINPKGYNDRILYPVSQMGHGKINFADSVAFPLHQANREFVYPAPLWDDRHCHDSGECSPCRDEGFCVFLNDTSFYALIVLPVVSLFFFFLVAALIGPYNWTQVTGFKHK